MCEETKSYLWAVQDVLGHGATSQVYKAYDKQTGELVAAKVYQVSPNQRTHGVHPQHARGKDYRPILSREMDILKSTNHENIVRYIGYEPVTSSDKDNPPGTREALFLEYCNGGSLHNVLEAPENRFGLSEDNFMLVFRHLTNALRYLHDKNTIHRDIKPDNIMLSINVNGEKTYKLADLGVARLIKSDEDTFTSLVGTEEYIHPDLYRAAIPDSRARAVGPSLQTRSEFPFEVDLWSLGVTLFQCATGELPFQPFAGTRRDRATMKHILNTKPPGCISGIEQTAGGEIKWSKTLPVSCRLSPSLKYRLENLLRRLLEANRNQLMSFREFFTETERIFNLIPIYYINLKRFQLNCGYFEPQQSVSKLYDELRTINNDEKNEYYCLFHNVPFPIEKYASMPMDQFREQLPLPTSRENPLIFYTFTSLTNNEEYRPTLLLPEVKPIRQHNDVAAAYDWSKDILGCFVFLKTQLIEYQHILQTAQCSTTIMQQNIKSKLLDFLCSIRKKLIDFRAIEELKKIIDEMDNLTNNAPQTSAPTGMSSSTAQIPEPYNSQTYNIGFSHLCNQTPMEGSLSPNSSRRSGSASSPSSLLIQQSTKNYLRSYIEPYKELKTCEDNILRIIEQEFGGQLGVSENKQPYVNTLWSAQQTNAYALWIPRVDKYLKDLNELHESFRKDRLLSTYNRLQADSHFRRRQNLIELHEKYVKFVFEECTPDLLRVFRDYNQWIRQRSNMMSNFEHIEESYKKQCEDIMNYVEMIDTLRQVVYRNIRELSSGQNLSTDYSNGPLRGIQVIRTVPMARTAANGSNGQLNAAEGSDNALSGCFQKVRGTTKQSIGNAEQGLSVLETIINQLRTNSLKK